MSYPKSSDELLKFLVRLLAFGKALPCWGSVRKWLIPGASPLSAPPSAAWVQTRSTKAGIFLFPRFSWCFYVYHHVVWFLWHLYLSFCVSCLQVTTLRCCWLETVIFFSGLVPQTPQCQLRIVIAKAMVLLAEKIFICVDSRRVLQPVILH